MLVLDLDNTQLGDLSPIIGLMTLQNLFLRSTPVIDLTLVRGFTADYFADYFADLVEAALQGVPATDGKELAAPWQTMAEVAEVLRPLAARPDSDALAAEKAALKRRIAQSETLLYRLPKRLSDEQQAHDATTALVSTEGFWQSDTESLGTSARVATVSFCAVGIPSAAVQFLGADPTAGRAV